GCRRRRAPCSRGAYGLRAPEDQREIQALAREVAKEKIGEAASNRTGSQTAGGGGDTASGTWCQRTILPPRMRKMAVARWPGPSHALVRRFPRRKVAVT